MLQEDMRRRLYVSAMQRGAAVYAVLLLPLGYVMPSYLAWENGVLEMLQNIVLFGDMCLAVYFFRKTAGTGGKSIHRLWLAAAGYFLLLLGRELSWGRVFFPTGMDSHGPTFVSMNSIPGHEMIHAAIGVYTAVVFCSLVACMPWKKILHDIPFPTFLFCILAAAAVLASCGDKGLLFHSYMDANVEELSELLVYLIHGYFAWYYYEWFRRLA